MPTQNNSRQHGVFVKVAVKYVHKCNTRVREKTYVHGIPIINVTIIQYNIRLLYGCRASEMTFIVSGGALNSTHLLTGRPQPY